MKYIILALLLFRCSYCSEYHYKVVTETCGSLSKDTIEFYGIEDLFIIDNPGCAEFHVPRGGWAPTEGLS